MNVAVRGDDERCIEVLATGLSLFSLTSNGDPRPGAAREDGIACNGARVDKERKYGELTKGNRCRLVVVALETGGRWSVGTGDGRQVVC